MTVVLVVSVPAADAEVAADVLWSLGVRAIEERRPGNGGAEPAGDIVELWTHVGDSDAALATASTALGDRWPTRVELVADEPADTWREHVGPMWVDDGLVVVPAWQRPPDVPDGTITLAIEPGGAFGMGDHPTTRLCLRALRRLTAGGPAVDVFDVGCGTGVIAVAAAVLTGRPVRAIDISPAAVEATEANARRNGMESLVLVDDAPLAAVTETFDLVVANILAPTLVELADALRAVTRRDGRLVISGILDGRHDHVLDALAPMVVERTDVDAGWAAVTLAWPS